MQEKMPKKGKAFHTKNPGIFPKKRKGAESREKIGRKRKGKTEIPLSSTVGRERRGVWEREARRAVRFFRVSAVFCAPPKSSPGRARLKNRQKPVLDRLLPIGCILLYGRNGNDSVLPFSAFRKSESRRMASAYPSNPFPLMVPIQAAEV